MTDFSPFGAQIELFNSLSRETEAFVPIDPMTVRMYSCGPTVYNFAHLGNLRAYIFTDTLRRTLNWKGYTVNHVINITDVGHLTSDADEGDDKMEAAASKTSKNIWEVAAFYTGAFKQDLADLNILHPTLWSVATDHVQDMIAFANILEDHGATYELPSGLYFDTSKVPDYGRLAGARPEETIGRIDTVDGKRNAADFALWRKSPEQEQRQMEWVSPWGKGAPGWHLECSVMSVKYLGAQFDIHTGGIDHREIHHCNEIAQNQAYTNSEKSGANFWMHNNFLLDRAGKMSKSKGDFSTLSSLMAKGIHPLAYRLLCLSAHYRSELEFSAESVLAALVRLRRLVIAVANLRAQAEDTNWLKALLEYQASRGANFNWQRKQAEQGLSQTAQDYITQFDAALSADLMVPQALPVLEAVLSAKKLSADERLRLVASMDLALGLELLTINRADLRLKPAHAQIEQAEVEALMAERLQARANKDFATSDAIRDQLAAKSVEVMDGDPLGWDWRPDLG